MAARPALGIYFTDTFVQLARASGDGSRLEMFAETPLPPGIVVNGEIKNRAELTRQLQLALEKQEIGMGEAAVMGIPDNRVFLREFTIPKLPGKNIEEAIEWQVRSLLPVLPAEVETDWKMIGRDANDQIEVLLVAIPKTVIDAYLAVATAAGMSVVSLEPAVFANVRVIVPDQLKGKNQLLVYLASEYAELAYLTNGQPRYADYMPAADIQKRGNIAKVIADYIAFVNSKHPYRPVAEVILSGHHPEAENLLDHLKDRNLAAFVARNRVADKGNNGKEVLYTAVGLSLKPVVDKEALDLLPLEMKLKEHTDRMQYLWQSVLVVLIFVTVAFAGWLSLNYFFLRSRVADLTLTRDSQLEALSKETKDELGKDITTLNSLTDTLLNVNTVTGGEERVLFDLAASVPNGVALTSLLYNRDVRSVKLTDPLSSWITTGVANSRPLVLEFYNRLGLKTTYPNGRLYYGSLEKEIGVDFRVAGTPLRQ